MLNLLKDAFKFQNSTERDTIIKKGISNAQALALQIYKQKHQDIGSKVEQFLDLVLGNNQNRSLFQFTYQNSMQQSMIEWVSTSQKIINLIKPYSTFMKNIEQMQNYKMPLDKKYIPAFLLRNEILNQRSGYLSISSSSVKGYTVPLLDYVFIRLSYCIFQMKFIQSLKKDPQYEYQSDDIFFYISRNPYLLLLSRYLQHYNHYPSIMSRLFSNLKMYFCDQIILKYRTNRTNNFMRNLTMSSNVQIQPHYLLVFILMVKFGRTNFDEIYILIKEIISRFTSLVANDTQVYFRFFSRFFFFVFCRNSPENVVIQQLANSNPRDGVYGIQRYAAKSFKAKIFDRQQRNQYENLKPFFLKLLQKDNNLFSPGHQIHFSTIRTFSCFLQLEAAIAYQKSQASLSSQSNIVQCCLLKIHTFIKRLLHQKSSSLPNDLKTKISNQLQLLHQLFGLAYRRQIDRKRLDGYKEEARDYLMRGNQPTYQFSVRTYKGNQQDNIWQAPLKHSETRLLYNLMYKLAKNVDTYIPGSAKRKQPYITSLRYLANPYAFFFFFAFIIILLKIIF